MQITEWQVEQKREATQLEREQQEYPHENKMMGIKRRQDLNIKEIRKSGDVERKITFPGNVEFFWSKKPKALNDKRRKMLGIGEEGSPKGRELHEAWVTPEAWVTISGALCKPVLKT